MYTKLLILASLPVFCFGDVVNFDNFAAGTIVTTQLLAQNLLITPSGSGLSGRVTNVAINEFTTGPFGNSGPMALFGASPGDVLRLDFVTPDGLSPLTATSVSFQAGDGDSAPDEFRVVFFDLGLTPISVQTFSTGTAGVNVGCPGCTVRRVEISVLSPAAAPGSGMLIDDIKYQAAPEPQSIALAFAGLGALVLRRTVMSRRLNFDPKA